MFLLEYLFTQNTTFINLTLIFDHDSKNLLPTKIRWAQQPAHGDRTPSREETSLLHLNSDFGGIGLHEIILMLLLPHQVGSLN